MANSKNLMQAAAGNAAGEAVYVEDVFSTYLYEGNQTARSINNGIDLSGEGGLVWLKNREQNQNNYLFDTANGANKFLLSDNPAELQTGSDRGVTAFNSNGFNLGTNTGGNRTGYDYVSWTWRKQAGWFDIQTWTGDGSSTRNIAHDLGSAPGMIIVKVTSHSDDWVVYHRSLNNNSGNPYFLKLNSTATPDTGGGNFTTPSATHFGVRTNINTNGYTYVAYLFAHDDQSFGDDSDEAIIKCGTFNLPSYTDTSVSLGFEPQWVLVKNVTNLDDWRLIDVMRGAPMKGLNSAVLRPNLSNAEAADIANQLQPQSDGFIWTGSSGWGYTGDHIYIAIRRPMKTPEAATEVFEPNYTSSNQFVTTDFPVDLQWGQYTGGGVAYLVDRLRGMSTSTTGSQKYLSSGSQAAEASNTGSIGFNGFVQDGFSHTLGNFNQRLWSFKRAPGFFDMVAYTGTGANDTKKHNLGVTPEFIIVKRRNSSTEWQCYHSALGETKTVELQSNAAATTASFWNDTAPTSTVFSVNSFGNVNGSGETYIAYLFATLAGVSKVGTYTGTGSAQTIDCGFSGSPRFIMLRRTDTTGDWIVIDSARGFTSGDDPYVLINSSASEDATTDIADPVTGGFQLTSETKGNASGNTFIYLAIA